jgi:ATP-dependent Clp protease ATP-binding subunit ClpA
MSTTTKNHTPQLDRILRMAELESERDQSGHVGIEHLLIACFQSGDNVGYEMMQQNGLTLERLRALDFQPKTEIKT